MCLHPSSSNLQISQLAQKCQPVCMSRMCPLHSWAMLTNNHERLCRDHAEPLAGVGVQNVVRPAQLGIDFQGQVVGVLLLLLGSRGRSAATKQAHEQPQP